MKSLLIVLMLGCGIAHAQTGPTKPQFEAINHTMEAVGVMNGFACPIVTVSCGIAGAIGVVAVAAEFQTNVLLDDSYFYYDDYDDSGVGSAATGTTEQRRDADIQAWEMADELDQ